MPVTEYQWKSFDGLDLYALQWPSKEQPEAVVAFVHGHGDHCRRYDEWFSKLTNRNIAVLSFDYRGHGRSQGRRGVIRRFDDLTEVEKEAKWIMAHFTEIVTPLLLMQGRDDLISDATATRKLYDGSPGQINYREWEYAGHQLHNSERSSEVMDFMIDWIKEGI